MSAMAADLKNTEATPDRGTVRIQRTVEKPSASYGWLVFALVLFLVQVLPYLANRWVTDESWYAGPAFALVHGSGMSDPEIGPNDLEHRFDARPPGTALVMSESFRAFGVSTASARLGSVFGGLILIAAVFWLTRDVLGGEAAVVATFITASDNLIVLTSRTARPEALTVMSVMLALLAMKTYWRRRSAGWVLLSGLLMAMGAMFHITLLGYIVSLGLLAIVIDRSHGGKGPKGALLYAAGFLIGLVPFVTWILTAPLGREGFRQEYLSRAGEGLSEKLLGELHRYSDLFGFNMIHGHGLDWVPLRLPIPLVFVAASWLLWRFRRSWFFVELVLLIPTVLWLAYTVNKSSRYLALLAPLFSIAIGAGIAAVRARPRLHRAALVVAGVVIVLQAGANAVLLRAASHADYAKVGAELRSAIPADQTAYGTITFWMAFRDQPFISYERTDPLMAAKQYGVRYFIVGDRVLAGANGAQYGGFEETRDHMNQVVAQSELVAHVSDPYYGDLNVYRLRN